MTTSPIEQTTRAGGLVLALGAAGVMATSAFYGVSPPEAALPVIPADFAVAASAAMRGQATMHLAGLLGMAVNPHIIGISIAGSATLFTAIGIRYTLTGRF